MPKLGPRIVRYDDELMRAITRFQFMFGADMESYVAVVLTPKPRLAEVE